MTSQHSKIFWNKVVVPNMQNGGILLLDSWGGQKKDIFEDAETLNINIQQIPPNTTGIAQPADVFFFR